MSEIDVKPLAGKEPVQMTLTFRRVYSDAAIREAMRGIKAIIKEAIRVGAGQEQVKGLLDILIEVNPIVMSAIDLIDEKLMEN
jgi:hypothetical protein